MPDQMDAMDTGFIDRLTTMLGIKKDEINTKIEALDGDQMIDLNDAVAKGDKQAVQSIFDAAHEDEQIEGDAEEGKDVNPLFAPDKENVEDEDDEEEKDVEDEPLPEDSGFEVGDKVKVGKMEGVVEVPNGPSDTVGVRIEGKMRMVDREKVKRLNEGVLGMIGIPDLTRMQELAGIPMPPQISAMPAPIPQPAFPPDTQVLDLDDESVDDPSDTESSAKRACSALDQLERNLPNVRFSDLSPIRRRINALVTRLNERAARATKPAPKRVAETKGKPPAGKPTATPVREAITPAKRKTLADYMKNR